MEQVIFQPANNGGVMCKVNGRVSFPARNWRGQQPAAGDEWEVEVSGQNAAGTVNFLSPVRRISTAAEREAKNRRAADEAQARFAAENAALRAKWNDCADGILRAAARMGVEMSPARAIRLAELDGLDEEKFPAWQDRQEAAEREETARRARIAAVAAAAGLDMTNAFSGATDAIVVVASFHDGAFHSETGYAVSEDGVRWYRRAGGDFGSEPPAGFFAYPPRVTGQVEPETQAEMEAWAKAEFARQEQGWREACWWMEMSRD